MGVMVGMFKLALCFVVSSVLLLAPRSFAQTRNEEPRFAAKDVPAELRDWVPWVLWDQKDRECVPGPEREPGCIWPGSLELDIGAKSGRFLLYVHADAFAEVVLPGGAGVWPEEVKVDGQDAVVLADASEPNTWVTRGDHQIAGTFSWNDMPETLAVGTHTGVVTLTLQGKRILSPRRETDGRLWLGASATTQGTQSDSLSMEVFRRIDDGVPLQITTRLTLHASGRAREMALGNVLLPETVPLSVTSDLPARLENSGSLVVQLRAGTHTLTVQSRALGQPERLMLPARGDPWPASETWVWSPRAELREVAIGGAREIDPARTSLADDWKKLAAFELRPNDALTLATLRRGNPDPPPNQINLVRQLWLDFDGQGYTVKDVLSGTITREHRLDLQVRDPGTIRVDGEPELVTARVQGGPGGVELRASSLNLEAEFRLPQAKQLPADGWSEDVQSLQATLHLPPGWLFLSASGVDSAPSSWLSSWDLFAMFYVLLMTLAALKLGGRSLALLAFATLVFVHGEEDAPFWTWGAFVAVVALRRVTLPKVLRPLMTAMLVVIAGAWVVLSVPFAAAHLRAFVHPLLRGGESYSAGSWWNTANGEMAPVSGAGAPHDGEASEGKPAQIALELASPDMAALGKAAYAPRALEPKSNSGPSDVGSSSFRNLARDPKSIVQTGPGVPHWSWQRESLIWKGPVARDHQFSLWLLPPGAVRLLELLRVLGVLGFGLFLAKLGWRKSGAHGDPISTTGAQAPYAASGVVSLLLLVGCLGSLMVFSTDARAQATGERELKQSATTGSAAGPSADRLAELARRLSEAPTCSNCLTVARAELSIVGQKLNIVLDVHAGAVTRLRLPGPAASWVPERVQIGNNEHPPISLEGGVLVARISAGRQRVVLEGPVLVDDLALELLDRPQRIVVNAPEWEVSGIAHDGQLEGALTVTRRHREVSAAVGAEPAPSLAPWLTLSREIELGVSWVVRYRLTRETSADLPLSVKVPLLLGERVTVADAPVEEGSLVASFQRGQKDFSWTTLLEPRDVLSLTASTTANYAETWSLDCGVVWHCQTSGLVPIQQEFAQRWRPSWRPFPGEKTKVSVTRPVPVPGPSKTIEGALLTVTPGDRLTRASLKFTVRASAGGTQRVRLPAGALLQELSVRGEPRPSRLEAGAIAVGLSPGVSEVKLSWQEPNGIKMFWTSPAVILEGGAANVNVVVEPNPERWLLWLSGPTFGPSVLFWGYLCVVFLAALVLSRLPRSPLSGLAWLGLALGLTQIPAAAAIIAPGWFFALTWYEKAVPQRRRLRQLVISCLVILTIMMLVTLGAAIYSGLVVVPDMQVEGAGSNAGHLVWYLDRSPAQLPQTTMIGTSIWVWRSLMLLWSLWLASRLLVWLRSGWNSLLTAPPTPPLPPNIMPEPHEPADEVATAIEPEEDTDHSQAQVR